MRIAITPMEKLRESHETLSSEALKKEIIGRRKMQGQMVGQLYPSIVESEIEVIDGWLDEALKRELR